MELGTAYPPGLSSQNPIHGSEMQDVGVKEDPLLVHATRLADELEAISSRDVQQVFGLPLNLSQKLLEMLLTVI